MVVDFHAHCFAAPVAAKAMPQLAARSGARMPYCDGTPAGLLRRMAADGLDRCVIANIATNPRQQRAVNDFAISLLAEPRFVPFGSVHPDAPDALDELRRLCAAGVRGIKLHPDYQDFWVDEARMRPIYREAARLGLVTLFHVGVDIGLPTPVHCTPRRLRAALPWFEGAPVVAAHFGGYLLWPEAIEHLCGTGVYFDTSYSARRMPPPWAKQILAEHDPARILFGTDLPWADPLDELAFVRSLTEDAVLLERIFGGNAQKLLELSDK